MLAQEVKALLQSPKKSKHAFAVLSPSILYIFQMESTEAGIAVNLIHVFENLLSSAIPNETVRRLESDGDSRIVFLENQYRLVQLDLHDFLDFQT